MSTYYNAFLGKRTKDNKYEIIGPYILNKNGEMKLSSLWWRSQSFIKWGEWPVRVIPVEAMGKETLRLCTYNYGKNDTDVSSIGYWISAKEIYEKGSCEPVRGFLPIEEAKQLIASNYDQDVIDWELETSPLSAEFVACMGEKERNKYTFVSYIDYNSTRYHMWEISRALNGYEEYNLIDENEEFGIIFQVA